MIGELVMTEQTLRNKASVKRSIGMGSYNMDSHNVQRIVDSNGDLVNEGDVQKSTEGPYEIDYGSIVPKRSEVGNLIVPVCLSASHIAYGSIRMEPRIHDPRAVRRHRGLDRHRKENSRAGDQLCGLEEEASGERPSPRSRMISSAN